MKKIKNATIYNNDCFLEFQNLQINSIDLIATDPPYFLDGMDNNWSDKKLINKKLKARVVGSLPVGMKFDPKQGERLENFFYSVSKEAIRVLKPGSFFLVFSQPRLSHRIAIASERAGFEIRDMLIWQHQGGQGKAFTQNHFVKKMKITDQKKKQIIKKLQNRKTPQLRPKFETIIFAQKPKDGTFVENWLKWKTGLIKTNFEEQQTTILAYKKPKKEEVVDHMTVKPIEVMKRLIEICSIKNQIVLDPFMGSGTTGIAALRSSRKFIGFEIEKKYFDISLKRLRYENKKNRTS